MLGGALGSLTRYLFVSYVHSRIAGPFPVGTFLVNVTGSFLIGLVMTILTQRWMGGQYARLFLVVGFLGGYTTFSSLEYEAYAAVQTGYKFVALLYVVASAIAGYGAVALGAWLAARK